MASSPEAVWRCLQLVLFSEQLVECACLVQAKEVYTNYRSDVFGISFVVVGSCLGSTSGCVERRGTSQTV